MRILISILLTGLLIGCGSKGDSVDNRDDKIGGQDSSDFYFDLANEKTFGEQAVLMAPNRRVSRNHAVRPMLRLNTDNTYSYRHVVTVYFNNSDQIRDRFRSRTITGTWSVNERQIRLDGLGFGEGGFDFNGDRFLDLEITREFRRVDLRDEVFTFTYN